MNSSVASAAPAANVVNTTRPKITADPPGYFEDSENYYEKAGKVKHNLLEELKDAMETFRYGSDKSEDEVKKIIDLLYKEEDGVKAGELVNISTGIEYSPFMSACYSGNVKLVKYILDNINGVEINHITLCMTPLNAACSRPISNGDNIEMVKYLVEKGADVNKAEGSGQTALMWACYTGQKAIVDYLLDITNTDYVNRVTKAQPPYFTINVDRKTTGITALMIASMGFYPDIVKSLLAHEADFNMKDNGIFLGNKFTALEYAKKSYENTKSENAQKIINLLIGQETFSKSRQTATNPAGVGGMSSRPTGPKPAPLSPPPKKSWGWFRKNSKSRKNRKSRKSHKSRKSRKTRRN